jgi:hypothetical protein
MKSKVLTIILGMIFLIGIMTTGFASADRIIDNATGIYINNFVAGSTVQANFSYNYFNRPGNAEPSPLIFRINITSSDETNYPIWKGDFEMNGSIERCQFQILGGCVFEKTIPFNCSEENPLTINHPLGAETVYPENGTFYCYNPEGDLKLDRSDKVFLNIKSHPALWPGQYILSAEPYYLTDTYPPIVNILNKNDFSNYYRELSNIEVQANINEMNLNDYWGTIFTPSQNITLEYSHKTGNVYYFTKTLPINIPEGNYQLNISAVDFNGLTGSDNVTLKIDRTGPIITAIQPDGSIYEEIIPVELVVSDAKAGVNNQSVYYRLREMDGSSICPDHGDGTWSCYNSGWVNLPYNTYTETYKTQINTTIINLTSGQYWFEAEAYDSLGNLGIFN